MSNAGSDMFLMPSKYEPCVLGQLISFKYGTVPIVRKTGGLADTVNKDSGFVFEEYSTKALFDAVKRGVLAFNKKKEWILLTKKIMNYDYSWNISAKEYVEIYQEHQNTRLSE